MIKAAEIRKGNYHEGVDFSIPRLGMSSRKINGIVPHAITTYGIYMVDEGKMEFKPILLTEEWLVKFGFKKDREINTQWWNIFYKSNEINVYVMDGCFVNGIDTEIKYVHQLQNYYFTQTGEELILN